MIVFVIRVLGVVPLSALRALGAGAGAIAALFGTPWRRTTEINLGIAFPDLDRHARAALTRRSLIESGKTIAEIPAIWSGKRAYVEHLVERVSGMAAIEAGSRTGRGVIVALPHLGSWEILLCYLSVHHRVSVLYKAPSPPELAPFVEAARSRFGATMIAAIAGAARPLQTVLREGGIVLVAPDQAPNPGFGVFARFFGLKTNTMHMVPRLAAKTQASVVFGWAERLPWGGGFHVHFEPAEDDVNHPDLERAAAAMNRDIERCIRRCPTQYLWSYKRFRFNLPGIPSPYPRRRRRP